MNEDFSISRIPTETIQELLKRLSLVEENLYRCSSNAYESDFQLGCLVGISQQEITYLKEKMQAWIEEK